MADLRPSVIYREGPLIAEDYDEAIEALREAKKQLEGDEFFCRICEDDGHSAFQCHHNPLVMARRAARNETEYRCFHCGVAFDCKGALEHFGNPQEERPPACREGGIA